MDSAPSRSRRRLLQWGAAGMVGAGFATATHLVPTSPQPLALQPTEDWAKNLSRTGGTPLGNRAAARGILYGAASGQHILASDAPFRDRFAQECRILVAENELKWQTLRPSPTQYDFRWGDWLENFARTHNQQFRGHTLVWQQSLPPWFSDTVTPGNAERFLVDHIDRVVRHYAGKMHSWDVVNEVIDAEWSDRADRLSNSPWLQLLSKDYIELAFRAAAAADPNVLLVLNERWLDYDTLRDRQQRGKLLDLLSHLKGRGVPVQALGIQAHLSGREEQFNPTVLRNFLREVASMGLKILITELDVADSQLPADIQTRDRRIAQVYEEYLTTVLDEPAVIAVLTWGLSDRYTWLSQYAARPDGQPVRPLPLDADLNRKLAWQAIARAFDRAPRRGR